MLSFKATKWRPVLSVIPDGVLVRKGQPIIADGMDFIPFDGATLYVNTMRKPTSQGGTGWFAAMAVEGGQWVQQTVLRGERPADPLNSDDVLVETPEEFRLRAIIVALASGYTLKVSE